MISITLDEHVRQCDHCDAKNIKRTFRIQVNDEILYIGRVCVSKVVGIDTSGNPYRARDKIEAYFKELDEEDAEMMLNEIKEGSD